MKKILFLIITISGFICSIQSQHLFTINYNGLSSENVMQISAQLANTEVSTLSLKRNNENREVYPVAFSSVNDAKIIILNEKTGAHVVIIPTVETVNYPSLQLAPFFIEELRQSVLGEANRYVVMETDLNFSVKNAAAVSVTRGDVFIPRYFYGERGNIQEAFPKDREIIYIFKEKPTLISAFPNDIEHQRRTAQLEEEMSYYKYMYKLPDGVLCTYDEYHNPNNDENNVTITTRGKLQFILGGSNLTEDQTTATEYAFTIWGEELAGTVPVDIQVTTRNMGSGYLGSSWQQQHFLDPATSTFYHSALWNQIKGQDMTNLRDIRLEMNSNASTWYYGTDGIVPSSRYDWVTVMLHEVCHGLGFSSICRVVTDEYGNVIRDDPNNGRYVYMNSSGGGQYTNHPGIFDRQLYQGATGNTRFTDLDPAGRFALMESNNMYAGAPGSNLLAAHGGMRVKMFAPTTYMPGSSVSHWDESESFTTFMKYSIANGRARHSISTRELGIFLDMGWKQNLGIAETQRSAVSLQVAPNPASQIVELRIADYELRTGNIEFYNVFGQLVKSVLFSGQPSQRIDISDLNAGVYILKTGNETAKLVVR